MGSNSGDGITPGRIFVSGLDSKTNIYTFIQHFLKYGQLKDYAIIRDPYTGESKGFGFVAFVDPSAVDAVMKDDPHVINGKPVEIKRAKPRRSALNNIDSKMKRLFVGGIPKSVTEAEFKESFSKYGTVVECEIVYDHETMESRGFGFIKFQSEQVVDDMLANGCFIDMAGTMVEINRARRHKAPNSTSGPAFGSNYRTHPLLGGFDGSRLGDYGRYGGGGPYFGGSFGGYGGHGRGFPGYHGATFDYSSQFGSFGGSGLGAYEHAGYGSYGGLVFAGGYDLGPAASFGGPGGFFGSRGGYGGAASAGGYVLDPAASFGGPGEFYGSRGGYGGLGSACGYDSGPAAIFGGLGGFYG